MYNMEPKLLPMDLVLFEDAMRHVARIHRVIKQPRGNLLLVGIGGSGRQSLSRLATFIAEYKLFTINVTKNYRSLEFHDDLKILYTETGCENKKVVFLFNETQLKDESFLEDMNNILSSGVVPNLFGKDEMGAVYDGVRKDAIAQGFEETPDALFRFFIDRVRANLHIVLCMSPVGENLRVRCRMYPGLVNCTTIDWFHTWPEDALTSVALKFLASVQLPEGDVRNNVASLFSMVHMSVIDASTRMRQEMKRHNYVTPTHYLELTQGYQTLLDDKRKEIGSASSRLENGLAKLEDAKEQVSSLVVVVEKKTVTVAAAEADCQELLKVIVVEKQSADAQKAQVEADSERIAKEAAECDKIAADAKADLDVAMPALEKAMAEVDKLDKSAITEIKGFNKPPPAVGTVLEAVMIFMGKKTDWATAKVEMGASDFLAKIKTFDKDNVKDAVKLKIKKYVENSDFTPEAVGKQSKAAASLCVWVHAIYLYAGVAKEVEPKRNALKNAQKTLDVKQKALKIAQDQLAEVLAKVADLKNRYDTSVGQKNSLRAEAADLTEKLERADQLIGGLGGEYVRWQASIGVFKKQYLDLVGDCLVASAFLSYAGPFDTVYREILVGQWLEKVKEKVLPFSPNFSFVTLLADPVRVREWNMQGLPSDDFSTENGVIVTRGKRWPLMVDPQAQANKWLRKMEGDQLSVIDLKMKDFLRAVENGISFGLPVLLQDVLEELDPSLEPVLSKSIQKIGTREIIKLGDKELDYSKDFRFYLTTKLGNPHYTPEVSTKANIVNFSVKQEGLEAQLLGAVVRAEQPELEEESARLTIRVSMGKNKLVALEDTILRLLSESTGSLLDDLDLIKTLQQSKVTSDEVSADLEVAAKTQVEINKACEEYRAAATRASLVYFVLYDLSRVDPMYQFSLDTYFTLFRKSINDSRDPSAPPENVAERCKVINFFHTLSVYKYTCLGLFERHKLLFSLLLCIRILTNDVKINLTELDFVYFGGVGAERATQKKRPEWLDVNGWDNVSELDKLPNFSGLVDGFVNQSDEWCNWFMNGKPEVASLPGDWEDKCSELQRMCLLRAVRSDRVLFSATKFVATNIGAQFADPPPFSLPDVFKTSNEKTPLIFILSPGVDPTNQVIMLANQKGVFFDNVAMGQGQGPVAVTKMDLALNKGSWLLLANCHLMISWLADLEKLIEEKMIEGKPHPDFRLWISSGPSPQFPIGILQRAIKMTTEPPKGLRANMSKLLNLISEEQFERCGQRAKYKKLLFALTWFHSILLERRKFKALGFNVPYEFNDSDYEICHDIVIVFLDEYPDETPFDAMRYLIAEANYGGRVTDDWDRRLVNVYIATYFCPGAVDDPKFKLSELSEYVLPSDGTDLDGLKSFVRALPQADHPAAFGQHPNADISSQIEDTRDCLDTLVGLQPKAMSSGGTSVEERMLSQAKQMAEQVPKAFSERHVRQAMEGRSDPDPLKVVLIQEVQRYNKLLFFVHKCLSDLAKAMQGLVTVTPLLDLIIAAFLNFAVPSKWGFAYPSLKPLAAWTRDLQARCEQLEGWWTEKVPTVYWLPGLTYPTGFLTALLQTTARKNALAIDSLVWDFPVLPFYDAGAKKQPLALQQGAKEGAFTTGMFLEGARWNAEADVANAGCLTEPLPMELYAPMPTIHFKPVESSAKKKVGKGTYLCPLYMYPVRTGSRERPSFVATIELKSGLGTPEFWTKRGTALLLSLSF
jgi:dynein heavy chain